MSSTNRSTTLVRIAQFTLLSIIYYVVVSIILYFLRPDINPISQTSVNYTVGPYGFLMISAFIIMALGQGAMVIGLNQGLPESARSRIGLALLGLWALGNLIAGLFRADLPGADQTIIGTIALINGPIHILCLIVGALLVSLKFRHDEMWRPIYRTALVLTLLMVVEFIGTFVTIATSVEITGLIQRIFIVTVLAWVILVTMRLRTVGMEVISAYAESVA
ncbi:MAG: DUF998 domain-containing protein [Anaerolineales bacterium]